MKKILLAATGSVAVIKVLNLKNILSKKYEVKVIVSDYVLNNYDEVESLDPIPLDKNLNTYPKHIELAKWADLIIVVPASSNTLAKLNAGIADSPLLSTLLAARSKVFLVPAMNTYMYEALIKRNIISNLRDLNYAFIGPATGKLREGESGLGRMVEPEIISNIINNFFNGVNKSIAVSYGASKIKLDNIRYISNYSSGKLGKLIINELLLKGFDVLPIDISNISNNNVLKILEDKKWDTYISVGAFADIDVDYQNKKIKKDDLKVINLKKNIDVLRGIKAIYPNRKFIGFKHDELRDNAIKKMKELKLDYMVWNKIGSMNKDIISGEIIGANYSFEEISKEELAKKIVEVI